MSDTPVPRPPAPAAPPPDSATGDPTARFDELINGLDDLAEKPVDEHHDRLAEVHEVLHSALHEPPPTP